MKCDLIASINRYSIGDFGFFGMKVKLAQNLSVVAVYCIYVYMYFYCIHQYRE